MAQGKQPLMESLSGSTALPWLELEERLKNGKIIEAEDVSFD